MISPNAQHYYVILTTVGLIGDLLTFYKAKQSLLERVYIYLIISKHVFSIF